MSFIRRIALALFVFVAARSVYGQQDPGILTLSRVFGPEFSASSGAPVHWLHKKSGYTKTESSTTMRGFQDIVHYDPATGKRTVLVSAAQLTPPQSSTPLRISSFSWSPNEGNLLIFTNSKRVWRRNTRGDYWVYDLTAGKLRKIGGDAKPSSLMFAKFSPDSRKVAYVYDRDVYVQDLSSNKIIRITKRESDTIINGTFDWVYEEELSLRDGIRWSPDSRLIAFWQLDTKGVGKYYLLDNTSGLYQKLKQFKYPKVGTTNSSCKVGIARADGKALDLPFVPNKVGPKYLWVAMPGDPRNHYIARMDWMPGSEHLILQQLNRLQNTNKVMTTTDVSYSPEHNKAYKEVRTIFVERDKAWVDVHDHMHWIKKNSTFTWLSERDGWKHIYLGNTRSKKLELVTPGDYDVIDLLHADDQHAYYLASPKNATQQYLYRVNLESKKKQKISPDNQRGTHAYNISPDGKWAAHTFSNFDTPPLVELVSLPDHKVVKTLNSNEPAKLRLAKLKRKPTEFFRVDIGNGIELDGWLIKPHDFDPAKKYPALFYVYGEPAGQTVLDRWNGSRYLWHLMLAQQGYLVMSIDNRGTPAPRGRDWRKVVYRQVGYLAPKEQAAAVKALRKKWKWLDGDRVAIWGWSGGGSMSLNAIFRFPDVYSTAMSIAPVTNQRFYDTIYQERYMGLPQDNVAGYRKGSPITYARQLHGNLLLIHGTADDNVHYANTEALMNVLIGANKQFTVMSYPNRSHSIYEGQNTRRHLFTLMTNYLRTHVPPGPLADRQNR